MRNETLGGFVRGYLEKEAFNAVSPAEMFEAPTTTKSDGTPMSFRERAASGMNHLMRVGTLLSPQLMTTPFSLLPPKPGRRGEENPSNERPGTPHPMKDDLKQRIEQYWQWMNNRKIPRPGGGWNLPGLIKPGDKKPGDFFGGLGLSPEQIERVVSKIRADWNRRNPWRPPGA